MVTTATKTDYSIPSKAQRHIKPDTSGNTRTATCQQTQAANSFSTRLAACQQSNASNLRRQRTVLESSTKSSALSSSRSTKSHRDYLHGNVLNLKTSNENIVQSKNNTKPVTMASNHNREALREIENTNKNDRAMEFKIPSRQDLHSIKDEMYRSDMKRVRQEVSDLGEKFDDMRHEFCRMSALHEKLMQDREKSELSQQDNIQKIIEDAFLRFYVEKQKPLEASNEYLLNFTKLVENQMKIYADDLLATQQKVVELHESKSGKKKTSTSKAVANKPIASMALAKSKQPVKRHNLFAFLRG